ncbi:caspase Dronc [Procambarus clarkii]|uniref:caspase Dronc n=1 Tax=Procambarus clarkii TaxID=6728 RepID=UPI001E67385C|nr:uncharacterized protein LOC123763565 [Procambarus clarkii]
MGWREMYNIMVNAFRTKKKKKRKIKSLEAKDVIRQQDQNKDSQVTMKRAIDRKSSRKVPKKVVKEKKESQVAEIVVEEKNRESVASDNVTSYHEESQAPENFIKQHKESSYLVSGECVLGTDTSPHNSCCCPEYEDEVFEDKKEPREQFSATTETSAEALFEDNGEGQDLLQESVDKNRLLSRVERRSQKSASMPDNMDPSLSSETVRPRINTEVSIYLDNDEVPDTPDHFQNARKVRHRGRKNNSSHIQVKYTKVYGEADGAYKNDSTPRGLVFICNISKFEDDIYPERKGSEKDYENLMNLFQQMGYGHSHRQKTYCVTGYVTKHKFMQKIKAFSQEEKHAVLCSCVVIIMSHGSGPKKFITSDNKEVDLMEVYKIFDNINCRILLGKPKIFILQFCRNTIPESSSTRDKRPIITETELRKIIHDEVQKVFQTQQYTREEDTIVSINPKSPVFLNIEEMSRNASISSLSSLLDQSSFQVAESSTHTQDPSDGDSYQTDTRNLPVVPQEGFQRYSDMYSIFSTSPGELSHRHPRKGSLLIQAICHVFAEFAYQDEIDNLVRKVSTYMTKTLQKDDPITVPRQTCERTNNGLDKYFYFNPEEILFCRHVTI